MNSITGKIIKILPPVSGESKKNPGTQWMRQEYVLETLDMYPRKVCFQLWGQDRIQEANIQMDEVITLEFDIESREYNDRWYTSINGRNIRRGEPAQYPAGDQAGFQQQHHSNMPQTNNNFGEANDGLDGGSDDLPF